MQSIEIFASWGDRRAVKAQKDTIFIIKFRENGLLHASKLRDDIELSSTGGGVLIIEDFYSTNNVSLLLE